MKKVLFLIQWYPSVLSANALCDKMIIDELVKNGKYDVDVLAYRPNGSDEYEEFVGLKVYRFIRSWWWNKVIDAKKNSGIKSSFIHKINRLILRLNQFITIPFYPEIDILAIRRFKREAYKMCMNKQYDLIVAEHHGIDSLNAGIFIKQKFPNIKFIAILWDPISAKLPPKYLPTKFAIKRLISSEKKLLKLADKVVAMKSSEKKIHDIMFNCSLFEKYEFLDIPRIVRPKESSNNYIDDLIKKEKINIVYSGILSLPDRDPEYIIKTLNLTKVAEKINLIFLTTGAGKRKLHELKRTFKGNIIDGNYIDNDKLTSLYNDVDVFLNFGGSNPNMVPSKIFEFMSYGKPIISTYSIDDESSKKYFKNYSLAVCIDQRKPYNITANDLDIFFDISIGKRIDFEKISQIYSNNTPQVYIKLINSIFE